MEGRATASFTFDTTILRIAALMHTRSISNVFRELFSAVEQTFKPEANVNMLLHQVFDTMLSFAARVLGGEMPDDDATTQWAFEQIYSFVVPNVRERAFDPIWLNTGLTVQLLRD